MKKESFASKYSVVVTSQNSLIGNCKFSVYKRNWWVQTCVSSGNIALISKLPEIKKFFSIYTGENPMEALKEADENKKQMTIFENDWLILEDINEVFGLDDEWNLTKAEIVRRFMFDIENYLDEVSLTRFNNNRKEVQFEVENYKIKIVFTYKKQFSNFFNRWESNYGFFLRIFKNWEEIYNFSREHLRNQNNLKQSLLYNLENNIL